MEFDPARRVLEALERERVDYAVFGGIAVNIHGLARATQDLDIFIAPEADRMKKDTLRPKDRVDAAELRRRFGLEDD